MSCACLTAVALGLFATVDEGKDQSHKELDRLQGEWQMVSGRQNGIDMPEQAAKGMRCIVQGARVSFQRDGKVVEEVTIKLDPSRRPKALDATVAKGQVAAGIYTLEDEIFTLCYGRPGKDRPVNFEAKEGSGHSKSVWKKVKPVR
jgi:uncharacterized protein (TIGR03067 family)